MKKKPAPTPTATDVSPQKSLTPEQIERLQRDQRQLRAIMRMLTQFNVGQPGQPPATRVKQLLKQRETHRDTIVKLIARKKSQPYL